MLQKSIIRYPGYLVFAVSVNGCQQAIVYSGQPENLIVEALPASDSVRLIRGVVPRGANLPELASDTLFLALFTFVGVLVASPGLRKRLG